MAATDSSTQGGNEKIATNALTTVNGTNVSAELIESPRIKAGYGADGAYFDVYDTQPYPVKLMEGALVSTANSSVANLAGAAAFTGTAEDVSQYSTIVVTVFSSHVSAADGLSIEQGPEGTNWDHKDVFTVPATTGKAFSVPVTNKFFRLVYTNGATLTTSLRIQVIFSKFAKKSSSVRPQDARANDNDMEEVLSYLMAFNGTSWDRVRAAAKNIQSTSAIAVQNQKDTGRNARHFILDTYTAAPVADALQSVAQWYSNAAVAATTTPAVVPAGKTLRLQGFYLETKSLATVGSVVVRVRVNTAGVAAIGSPVAFTFGTGSKSGATTIAMTGGSSEIYGVFPEGFEIPAGAGVGFSLAGYGPTGALTLQGVTRFAVYGYEY